MEKTTLENVREYGEEHEVTLETVNGRLCVVALNEGRLNSTAVDLLDLISWVKAHRPDLLS